MRIFRDLDALPNFENTVITIGSFDGVHFGHQKIIERINQIAKDIGGESVMITFYPHPRSIIFPKDKSLRLLNSIEEKLALFEKFNVDTVVIVPFSFEFSQMNPREYVEEFLIKKFKPSQIVLGYDHRFGLNRQGDITLLKIYEKQGKFKLQEINKKEIEDITISSTQIRNSLLKGDLAQANLLLNHNYTLEGTVAHGKKIGDTLGYPTANIALSEKLKLVPYSGIYAVKVFVSDTEFKGMLYIGPRPTIKDNDKVSIEVNIFDFKDRIYDHKIKVELLSFIREDETFDSLDDLKSQLALDEKNVRHFFKEIPAKRKSVDIAIAILNYNGQDHLQSYLPSVGFSSSHPFEVCVIDNASSDNSIKICEEWHPEIKVIQLAKNHGFADGYNRGLQQVKSKYYAILNSDVMVTENWLDPIIEKMEIDDSVAACMPKIRSLEKKDHFEYAGASGGYLDRFGYPFCRGRILDHLEKDNGQYDEPAEVFWTTGAAMVIRSEVFHNLGGFDAEYFAHMEEIDLCWRIKKAGYKLMVIPESIVYHLGGGTLQYDSPQKIRLNFKNSLATIIKNESLLKLIWLFPLRLILDGVAGIKFALEGKFSQTVAIIKAHLSIYAHFFHWIKKRKSNHALIEKYSIGKDNTTGRIKKSIIFNYYIAGKKTFSDIVK